MTPSGSVDHADLNFQGLPFLTGGLCGNVSGSHVLQIFSLVTESIQREYNFKSLFIT